MNVPFSSNQRSPNASTQLEVDGAGLTGVGVGLGLGASIFGVVAPAGLASLSQLAASS